MNFAIQTVVGLVIAILFPGVIVGQTAANVKKLSNG
jgi:hypothetical protein